LNKRPLRSWETLSRKTVLDFNRFLSIESHRVQLPDGEIIEDWPWVVIPSAVIILAQTPDEQFLCFRQTKYAVEGTTLAVVGGMIEEDEEPLSAAHRELLEETGCRASQWIELGSYWLDPNRGIARMHLYLARQASKVAEPDSDDLEDQQLISMTREQLESALQNGDFKVLSWAAAVSMGLRYLEDHDDLI
jgi:ADP-ribose pyrophosphatase